jgi:phosphatidylglycerophosphate synthase
MESTADLRRRVLKPRDSWWTVAVIDPLTTWLLPAVMRIPGITPMRITLAGFAIGVASMVSFAAGAVLLAGVLFQLRYIVDCLDGKVARATGRTSEWGRFADLAIDVAVVSGAYAALTGRMLLDEVATAWLGLLLLPLFASAAWIHLYRRLALGQEERTSRPQVPPSRLWARSRFRPYPAGVEVETLVLVIFPILLPADWFRYVVAGALVFYGASAADGILRVHRQVELGVGASVAGGGRSAP